MKILYISYDGLLEPLGQSQVLQYLKELAKQHTITLVSYEKAEDWQDVSRRESLKKEVCQAGLQWVPLKYHKRPSAVATAYDILVGFLSCSFLISTRKIRIVHARSYVPSVVALCLKKVFGLRYIFDMRGFWVDERVDGNIWPHDSRIYPVAKWFERRFLLNSDVVVSLTHAGVDEIKKFSYLKGTMPRFEIIPTCTNLKLFTRNEYKEKSPFTLGYVGSVGTWYLLDEMLECFRILYQLRPGARMRFINRNDHALIKERAMALGIFLECIDIKAVNHCEVAKELSQMDAGIMFYKPDFSKKATSPTKLGEFLACGIPCLGNSGVGDVEMVLSNEKVGIVVNEFDEKTLRSAMEHLLAMSEEPEIGDRCRKIAEKYFSLDEGVRKYDAIYRSLSC